MGDEIELKNIDVIQGGTIQIDFYNKTENRHDRCFCDPKDFFKMIGIAMQANADKWMEDWQRQNT